MKSKPSSHAYLRFEERVGMASKRNVRDFVDAAKRHGQVFSEFGGEFGHYLRVHFQPKNKKIRFKVYDGFVVVFGGDNQKIVLTVVPLPEKYHDLCTKYKPAHPIAGIDVMA